MKTLFGVIFIFKGDPEEGDGEGNASSTPKITSMELVWMRRPGRPFAAGPAALGSMDVLVLGADHGPWAGGAVCGRLSSR
jgi:hypothetical protein